MTRLPIGPLLGLALPLLAGCGAGPPPPIDVTSAPIDSTAAPGGVLDVAIADQESLDSLAAAAPRPEPRPVTPVARLVEGFRVQLFQSTSLRLAEAFRDEAAPQFDVPVYVEYEAPLYKVRAGNFRLRAEAESWASNLVGRGFQRVDVVATLVDTGALPRSTPE